MSVSWNVDVRTEHFGVQVKRKNKQQSFVSFQWEAFSIHIVSCSYVMSRKLAAHAWYASTHAAKKAADVLPPDKANWGLILLFPIDTAKGSIIGLLQTTCIMLNSSGWYRHVSLFSSLLILVIQSSSSQQGRNPHSGPPCLGWHFQPLVTPHFLRTEVRIWGWGQGSRGEEQRGPVWLSPNGASCGYPSNTDYYVVPPLTLMGCYNDLKWFNGSQVGAPNGPLYTPMRIMNGNDSVVKCLCFSRFLFSLSLFFKLLLRQCDRCRFVWW